MGYILPTRNVMRKLRNAHPLHNLAL